MMAKAICVKDLEEVWVCDPVEGFLCSIENRHTGWRVNSASAIVSRMVANESSILVSPTPPYCEGWSREDNHGFSRAAKLRANSLWSAFRNVRKGKSDGTVGRGFLGTQTTTPLFGRAGRESVKYMSFTRPRMSVFTASHAS